MDLLKALPGGVQLIGRATVAGACTLLPLVSWAATVALTDAQQAWLTQQREIRWAVEADYPPFIFVDQKAGGAPQGMSADFLALIAQKTGVQLRPQPPASLPDILKSAQAGGVDIVTSLRPTPDRSVYLGFTIPYVKVPTALVVTANNIPQDGLSAMVGKPIGVSKGYSIEPFVRERFPQVGWVSVQSDQQGLEQLQSGRLAGMVMDVASAQFLMQSNPAWGTFHIGKHIGFEYELGFGYRKDLPMLGEILQAGLLSLTPDERDAVLVRWLPQGQKTSGYNLPLFVAGGLLLLSLAGLLWRLLGRRRNQPD
jgi:ABC-type amino acid transport substrate-binding protein